MPTAHHPHVHTSHSSARRRPSTHARSHSHGSSTSLSSLGKAGGRFGGGLGMTSAASTHSDEPAGTAQMKRRKSEAPSLKSSHSHVNVSQAVSRGPSSTNLASHRSESHLPRLGALQRTVSEITVTSSGSDGSNRKSKGESARRGSRGGLMDGAAARSNSDTVDPPSPFLNGKPVDEDGEEGWQSGSSSAASSPPQASPPPVQATERRPSAVRKGSSGRTATAHHPEVYNGGGSRQGRGRGGMFRVHSGEQEHYGDADADNGTLQREEKKINGFKFPSPSTDQLQPLVQESQHQRTLSPASILEGAASNASTPTLRDPPSPTNQLLTFPSAAQSDAAPHPPANLMPQLSPSPTPAPAPPTLRYPQLRKASSKTSLHSQTTRPHLLPKRLSSLSARPSAAAAPQISTDAALSSPSISQGGEHDLGDERDERTALGHLRKASFGSFSTSGARGRTASLAGSIRSDAGGVLGSTVSGGASAMDSLSALRSTAQRGPSTQRRRIASSGSSTSLADLAEGVKRSVLSSLSALQHPSSSHPGRAATSPSATSSTGLGPSSHRPQTPKPAPLIKSHFVSPASPQPALPHNPVLHPSPFLDAHQSLLRGMQTAGPESKRTPMGMSVRRCLLLSGDVGGGSSVRGSTNGSKLAGSSLGGSVVSAR